MTDKIRKATHSGNLPIGDMVIPCAVLEDGTRVLSEHGITEALLGSRSGASKRIKRASTKDGAPIPLFLAPPRLLPFISEEFTDGPPNPFVYEQGNRRVHGFEADVLTKVCNVWLKAREAGVLQKQQLDKARKAEILMRGLAYVGITALIDEVTGYQEIRDREALQQILDKYLAKEFAEWAKRFPDEFYKQIFRLKGWQWRGMKVNRPSIVAHYTNDLVYERLAPGILTKLQDLNPKDAKGNRKHRHHQWLTEDIGIPELGQHLHAVISFMRASATWDQLHRMVQRAFPKINTTGLLNFPEDE